MAISLISTFLTLSSLLVILLSTPSALADESNILLTGETIATDGQLSYRDASFVMQNDCNLVLYDKTGANGFASNTYAYGPNCTVTLNEFGQLVIRNAWGSAVWNSGLFANTTKGKYAAVLQPDGQVAVYGPTAWSSAPYSSSDQASVTENEAEVASSTIPIVKNVLFSSQVLNPNDTLATRDYTLVMKDDCNLELIKAGRGVTWQSGTLGRAGKRCFARLSHRGRLVIEDDFHRTLWSTLTLRDQDGDYVLILQINGRAAIYGPKVWST